LKSYVAEEKLAKLAETHNAAYQSASPFPHIVIDDFLDEPALAEVLEVFPSPKELEFYKYENPLEKKLAMDQLSKLPDPISALLLYLNTTPILQFMEKLTGIEGLIPDPYYRGGGIHQIVRGGKLDVHIDFNKHQKLNLDRRLNAIIYLNKDWEEAYGGHLEIWRGHQKDDKHILEECTNKVLPIFNRLVVFSTSERSYHGHPEPVTCPEGWSRKSIALYYYTNGRPKEEDVPAHSTTFIKRPEDVESAEIEALREKRNRGRMASNV